MSGFTVRMRPSVRFNEIGTNDDDKSGEIGGGGGGGGVNNFEKMAENYRRGKWNVFEYTEEKKNVGSSVEDTKRFRSFIRIVKLVISVIVFCVILGSSVLSKLSLMFMISHVKPGQEVPFCDNTRPKQNFKAIVPEQQTIAWIWAIIFAFAAPELGTLFRSWRFCFFKNVPRPSFVEFLFVFCIETLHVIGLAVLMIVILPNLNGIQGVILTSCLCFIPAMLSIFSDISRNDDLKVQTKRIIGPKIVLVFNILAFWAQITGFVVWPLNSDNTTLIWATPFALILISFHWWENFVSANSRFLPIVRLSKMRVELERKRYTTHLYVSMWKIFVFGLSAILLSDIKFRLFFDEFTTGWAIHKIEVTETVYNSTNFDYLHDLSKRTVNSVASIDSTAAAICWTLFIQVVASYVCYVFTKFACKIKVQTFSFGLPMTFAVPLSMAIICFMGIQRNKNVCAFHGVVPDYLFFATPPFEYFDNFLGDWIQYIPLLWIFSQSWITRHIWSPKSTKNASTDSLFVTPLYNGLIIDQSLALNRRRYSFSDIQQKKTSEDDENTVTLIQPEDTIPQLYVCGTMWHEEKEEIIEFLKSILRLDEDYSARRLANEFLHVDHIECEYYNLESHIFFDDAFGHDVDENISADSEQINKYVTKLITSLADASVEVYKTDLKYETPIRYPTPYGGRLEWTLPGGTKLIAHLKNKKKIMAKKRWSQVMYMYYLLGYRLMEKSDLDDIRKTVRSENTFLLALDGDIDFQPDAVHLLMNRMKVDENLGAACGRIHPIGDGPMVWYQKFEYAIGHWLQKATEHVIGCVLCSPGCFSLFRGSALMDGGIIKKYTTVSEDASNFVQYDQGEDRWLCTLILKEKYRVEYSAASDAYTHAPTGFFEFYNQRRRWIPSTMANILDLLMNYKPIVKKNDSISMLYIIYQGIIMVGTILGPGTIFLMMIGALVAVFDIDIFTAFLYNFIPIAIFMLICYEFKKIQLMTAFILTAVYSLVMMAVLIGVVIQLMDDGIASPSSIFFIAVFGEIFIAGILHPKEMGCLICGVIYYITIPSMYMLLIIYSLFNMNDVSWGTRETKTEADKDEGATKGIQIKNGSNRKKEEVGLMDISFFGLFRCLLCPQPKNTQADAQVNKIKAELHEIKSKVEPKRLPLSRESVKVKEPYPEQILLPQNNNQEIWEDIIELPEKLEAEPTRELEQKPDWLLHPTIRYGKLGRLDTEERDFWTELIAEYLKPPKMTDAEKKIYNADVIQKLKSLRDKCVASFVMINALFVVVVYLLQLNKEHLHVVWPYGAENQIAFDEANGEIMITREFLQVEPIGLLFVVFFGFILLIQFVAMLVHRVGTVSQILADVDINLCNSKIVQTNAMSGVEAVKMVKRLQSPKALGDVDETTIDQAAKRRNTIKKIMEIQKNKRIEQSSLRTVFLENPDTEELFRRQSVHVEQHVAEQKLKPSSTIDFRESPSFIRKFSTVNFQNQVFRPQSLESASQGFRPQSFDRPISGASQTESHENIRPESFDRPISGEQFKLDVFSKNIDQNPNPNQPVFSEPIGAQETLFNSYSNPVFNWDETQKPRKSTNV